MAGMPATQEQLQARAKDGRYAGNAGTRRRWPVSMNLPTFLGEARE